MACVNINHPDFKTATEIYGISREEGKVAIKAFMDSNGLDTWDINSKELRDFLDKRYKRSTNNLIKNPTRYNTLYDIWKRADGITTTDSEKAAALYEHYSTIFDKENVVLYKNDKDEYAIRVAEPILYDKEMGEILAKAPRNEEGKLLVRPNGPVSNLTEIQYAQVRTKAFKRWFGDWENDPKNASKVVDENGEPLVVYHESNNKFNTFDLSKKRYNVHKRSAIWTSPIDREGEGYGEYRYPLFLNIRNLGETKYKETDTFLQMRERENSLMEKSEYDGIKILTIDKFGEETQYAVYSPNQVKSATSNNGEFNKENDNIFYRKSKLNSHVKITKEKPFNLSDILSEIGTSDYNTPLYKNAIKLAEQLNIKFKFGILNDDELGSYSNGVVTIGISKYDPEFLPTLYHELLHSVTSHILHADKSNLTSEQIKAVNALNTIYDYVKNNSDTWKYAFTNIDEFLAEIANSDFRDYLKSVTIENNKTLWEKLVEAFKSIFGLNALDITEDVIESIIISQSEATVRDTAKNLNNYSLSQSEKDEIYQYILDLFKTNRSLAATGQLFKYRTSTGRILDINFNPTESGTKSNKIDGDGFEVINEYDIIGNKINSRYSKLDVENSYEVSTVGDSRFSALNATFKQGTIIEGVEVFTDKFANTRVNQARALADILNKTDKIEETPISTQLSELESSSMEEDKSAALALQDEIGTVKEIEEKEKEKERQAEEEKKEDESIVEQEAKSLREKTTALYNNLILSAEERSFLANNIMHQVSVLITQLQTNPSAKESYFGKEFPQSDFTKKSRKEIIEMVSIGKLLNVVKERMYNPVNLPLDIEDEIIDKFQVAYDNWEALVMVGYPKLIALEGVSLTASPEYVDESIVNEIFQEQMKQEEDEAKSKESWQIGVRSISVLSSLSKDIRRRLENLYITTKADDGSVLYVKDKYGFGFDTFVDSKVAVNDILDWCRNCDTLSQMEAELESRKEKNPWVETVLEMMKEEPLRSQFYQNFRKDFTNYSIVFAETDPETHEIKYTVKIINTNSAAKTMLDNVSSLFNRGLMQKIIITSDNVAGKGTVNIDTIKDLYNRLKDVHTVALSNKSDIKKLKNSISSVAPEVTAILQELGIRIENNIVEDALLDGIESTSFAKSNAMEIFRTISYILKGYSDASAKGLTEFNPMTGKDNLKSNYKKLTELLGKQVQDSIQASVYQNGKMYYSFTTPSYTGKLMRNLKNVLNNPDGYSEFMENEYGKYRWFKEGENWNNTWLRLLNSRPDCRAALDHKVQLDYLGTPYDELSELGYAKSLITEFAYLGNNSDKNWAWYRVPILSNKPSSEFIKFVRFSGANYKEVINKELLDTFNQEVLRMKTVLERLGDDSVSDIKSFDIGKNKKAFENLRNKIINKKKITREDLVVDGKLITINSGASFKFLETFNNEIVNNTKLGQYIISKINPQAEFSAIESESEFNNLALQSISDNMEEMVDKTIKYYESLGLLDIEEYTFGQSHKLRAKHLPNLVSDFNELYLNTFGTQYKVGTKLDDTQKAMLKETMVAQMKQNLSEYLYNDTLATINIVQLTATDLAFYKDVNDFQKRYAQIHAPGLRLNLEAKVLKEGNQFSANGKYSADGLSRTIYIKDEKIVSENLENIRQVFDKKIASATSQIEKDTYETIKNTILQQYKNVNVTDAQAYNSPTSLRKKLGMQGKWNEEEEQAYQRIISGNMNVSSLNILWQALKPFVYSQNAKYGSTTMQNIKVGMQNKNSEYLIFLADAIMQGGGKSNKLKAIYDFMENSAFDIDEKGNRVYNGAGIDTVQFQSAVKVGEQGVIDISGDKSYDEIMQILEDAVYMDKSDRNHSSNPKRFNSNCVHTFSFEDYCVQQEVPAHMTDHSQPWGSQIRVLTTSDVVAESTYMFKGKEITGRELKSRFEELTAKNIQASFDELAKELKLSGTRKQKNRALARVLQDAILNDSKYGPDLAYACRLNDNDEFNIPLNDPIQSIRIQQMLNSIIKSRINKQKIEGGPVVQASAFGLSEKLHTVYNEDGSIKYFEGAMTCPSSELEKRLIRRDKDGNEYIMSPQEAIEKGIIPEEALEVVGYRIPTEGKYSMIPIKVVKFLPRAAGEALMLPDDITVRTGSDFDIDKIYIMRRSLHHRQEVRKDDMRKDLMNFFKEKYGEDTEEYRKAGIKVNTYLDYLEDAGEKSAAIPDEKYDSLYELERLVKNEKYRDRYFIDDFKLEEKNERKKNNNELLDITWAILTSPNTADQINDPGNFDPQKKISKIIQILQDPDNKYTYEQLADPNSKLDLDALINANSHNIIYASSQVYFHKQNMTAGKLIGIFANNNVGHAFLGPLNINLKISKPFTFDGHTVNSKSNNLLDGLKDKNGQYISKNIAGFLASSVDAVKDPVLNFLNLNTATTGAAMLLARLGFDVDSIGLFLSQPIIRKVVDTYFISNEDRYTSMNEAVRSVLSSLNVNPNLVKSYKTSLSKTMFTKDELAEGISNATTNDDFQVRALLLFQQLSNMATQLNDATFITKYNSISNAVGPSIADTMAKELRIQKFRDGLQADSSIFDESIYDKIMANPIIAKFRNLSNSLSSQIFKGNFINYSEQFQDALLKLQSQIKGTLDADTINKFASEFILFKMTYGENALLPSNLLIKNNFLKGFVDYFSKIKEELKDNDLIRIIKVAPASSKCPISTLYADTTGFQAEEQEKIKMGWEKLIADESTKIFAKQLFLYNMYRSGISFSPRTFLHLASVSVKQEMEGYVETLRDASYSPISIYEFIEQFQRNHSDNFRVVANYKPSNDIKVNTKDTDVQFEFKNVEDIDSIVLEIINRTPNFVPIIRYNNKLYRAKSQSYNSITYEEIEPLGIKNNFLEYDANTSSPKSMFKLTQENIEAMMNQREKENNVSEPKAPISDEDAESNDSQANTYSMKESEVMDILKELFGEEEINNILSTSSEDEFILLELLNSVRYAIKRKSNKYSEGQKKQLQALDEALNENNTMESFINAAKEKLDKIC